jgi:hypothetical protein
LANTSCCLVACLSNFLMILSLAFFVTFVAKFLQGSSFSSSRYKYSTLYQNWQE